MFRKMRIKFFSVRVIVVARYSPRRYSTLLDQTVLVSILNNKGYDMISDKRWTFSVGLPA